jgi:alanine racemase
MFCNSAGAMRFPELAGDMVRIGIGLYGSAPVPEFQSRLLPVMTWKRLVTLVRDLPAGCGVSYGRTYITPCAMRVATLAVGYADGYQRHLSNRDAEVVIRGERCPVLGRVTMDQIVVDVSGLSTCEPEDEAILLGAEIPAAELAEKAGTIPWEIFYRNRPARPASPDAPAQISRSRFRRSTVWSRRARSPGA